MKIVIDDHVDRPTLINMPEIRWVPFEAYEETLAAFDKKSRLPRGSTLKMVEDAFGGKVDP